MKNTKIALTFVFFRFTVKRNRKLLHFLLFVQQDVQESRSSPASPSLKAHLSTLKQSKRQGKSNFS